MGKRKSDADAPAGKSEEAAASGVDELDEHELENLSGGSATGFSGGDAAQMFNDGSGETASKIKFDRMTLKK